MMHSWMLHRGMHGLTIMMQATAKEINLCPETESGYLGDKKKKKKKTTKNPALKILLHRYMTLYTVRG